MYRGKNPSALRSQQWLTEALLQLMEEKPYRKISIKEITEKCDLARQTFYQLFDSKEEIIEYYLDILFEEYLAEMKKIDGISIAELTRLYLVFFEKHENFVLLLIKNDLEFCLNKKFRACLDIILNEVAPNRNISNYAKAFISSGLVGLLVYYSEDRSLSVDELFARMILKNPLE